MAPLHGRRPARRGAVQVRPGSHRGGSTPAGQPNCDRRRCRWPGRSARVQVRRSAAGCRQQWAQQRTRAAGSGQRAAGSGQRAAGSGQRAAGSGQRAAGSGAARAGQRGRATGPGNGAGQRGGASGNGVAGSEQPAAGSVAGQPAAGAGSTQQGSSGRLQQQGSDSGRQEGAIARRASAHGAAGHDGPADVTRVLPGARFADPGCRLRAEPGRGAATRGAAAGGPVRTHRDPCRVGDPTDPHHHRRSRSHRARFARRRCTPG
jgi:hypothetical protein